jgi:hypothetical protein
MVLKKSIAKAQYATIESKSAAIRFNVAPAGGFLNQNCAATLSKSFFNTIDPYRHARFAAGVSDREDVPHRLSRIGRDPALGISFSCIARSGRAMTAKRVRQTATETVNSIR